ncbi:hypothetical protein N2Q23_25065, partial [Escherichia coli]|uniref:hypothetical protein n=1 Tax=Escherichia coli TaxID=562 RepID=UPI0021B1D1A9
VFDRRQTGVGDAGFVFVLAEADGGDQAVVPEIARHAASDGIDDALIAAGAGIEVVAGGRHIHRLEAACVVVVDFDVTGVG